MALGVVSCLVLPGLAFAQEPLTLEERLRCTPAQEGAIADHAAAVRAARPGDDLYLPFPFPRSDDEVLADTTQQIERLATIEERDERQNFPARAALQSARSLAWNAALDVAAAFGAHVDRNPVSDPRALRDGLVRIESTRVEDWTALRCHVAWGKQRIVVRFFDTRDGVERARAELDEAGHLGQGGTYADRPAPAWPDIGRVVCDLGARYHLSLREPRLVRGGEGCAYASAPCVALETTDHTSVYFWQEAARALYRVSTSGPWFHPTVDFPNETAWLRAMRSLPAHRELFEMGPDLYTVAEIVERPEWPPPR